MSARVFFDTNVLVYLFDATAPEENASPASDSSWKDSRAMRW